MLKSSLETFFYQNMNYVKNNKKILMVSLILLTTLLFYLLYLFAFKKSLFLDNVDVHINTDKSVKTDVSDTKSSTSDKSFEELTIPYLRTRKYESRIGIFKKFNESETYTTYITNFDSDGLNINGLLTVPKGDKPENGWPAIVFVHGYIPPEEYKTTENYKSYVDFIAKNGFVVFKIDLRGHGDSEGDPGGAYYSSDYVIDTLNAYNALQSSNFVDSEKIGLWGHSMGGNVVFRAFVAKQDIKAVSIWAGTVYTYSDFSEYGIEDNSYSPPSQESPSRKRRNELFEMYGNFEPNNEFWMKVVPTNYLGGLDGAVQINHAVDDNVVSIEYTRNLSGILLDTNIKHEIHEYPSGGHNISGAYFEKAMQNTVDFYKRQLD